MVARPIQPLRVVAPTFVEDGWSSLTWEAGGEFAAACDTNACGGVLCRVLTSMADVENMRGRMVKKSEEDKKFAVSCLASLHILAPSPPLDSRCLVNTHVLALLPTCCARNR